MGDPAIPWEEGLKTTGASVSWIFAPFGFYQELQLAAADGLGEADDTLAAEEPANKELGGLTGMARFRNYWDLSEAANLEISASALSGKRIQPFDYFGAPPAPGVNAVNARQTVVGGDLTFRWRPLQQGLYRSFILQAEFLRQVNERVAGADTGVPRRTSTEHTRSRAGSCHAACTLAAGTIGSRIPTSAAAG